MINIFGKTHCYTLLSFVKLVTGTGMSGILTTVPFKMLWPFAHNELWRPPATNILSVTYQML